MGRLAGKPKLLGASGAIESEGGQTDVRERCEESSDEDRVEDEDCTE
jgi:hypothetical protein